MLYNLLILEHSWPRLLWCSAPLDLVSLLLSRLIITISTSLQTEWVFYTAAILGSFLAFIAFYLILIIYHHNIQFGSFAGIWLVLLSGLASSSVDGVQIWEREAKFYIGVALPCVTALLISNAMTTYWDLKKPERVTSCIECVYQVSIWFLFLALLVSLLGLVYKFASNNSALFFNHY